MASTRRRRWESRWGQVVIEMLIILPMFLMLTFMIMEIGHLAFSTIVLHHAAFELARIGSLSAAPRSGEGWGPQLGRANSLMNGALRRVFPKGNSSLSTRVEENVADPQSGIRNRDLVVTVEYACPLVFPFTSMILESKQGPIRKSIGGARTRMLYAEVRMPIQMPTYK